MINESEYLRLPALMPCPCCGGTGDYHRLVAPPMFYAGCVKCGMRTADRNSPGAAGEDWNRRYTDGARIITLNELSDAETAYADADGDAAVWIEVKDGKLYAALLRAGIDFGETSVSELTGAGIWEQWSVETITGEGVDWRIWTQRPTDGDRAAAKWDGPAWVSARMRRAKERTDALLESLKKGNT